MRNPLNIHDGFAEDIETETKVSSHSTNTIRLQAETAFNDCNRDDETHGEEVK
jgi:hypothetical protein